MYSRMLAYWVGTAALGIGLAGPAAAAGFAVQDYNSAAQLGTARAGAAAAGEDAASIADNPAGIARLTAPQIVGSGTIGLPQIPFTSRGSTLPTGAPIPGPNDDGDTPVLLPSFFWASPFRDGLSVGFGLFPAFGLATDYEHGYVGRYNALASELTSLDLAPTVAYQVMPGLSVGISPVARYTKVEFTNAIDFGSAGAGLGIPGSVPGANDGGAKLKVSAWSFAFNGGVLWEPTDTTRLGLAYFHNDATKVTGSATFSLGQSAVGSVISAATGAFTNTGASSLIGLPDHANFGIIQKLTPDLDVRGGVTWTQWSSFKQELVTFTNPNQPPSLMIENWRDTVTLSLGTTYKLTPDIVLRGGLSYDETPVPDPQHRDLRLPDASRYGIAIGAGYALSDSTTIDVAYQHLFGGTVSMHVATSTADQIVGTTNLSADLLAFQVTYRY